MKFRLSWKLRIALGVLILPFFAEADAPPPPPIQGWTVLSATPNADVVLYIKNGSGKVDAYGAKVLIQVVENKALNPLYSVVTISRSACNDGYGSLNFHPLSQDVDTQSEYVKGGGSFGDILGDSLCNVLEKK